MSFQLFVLYDVTLRAEPPFVFFFTEEEKRRLCLNRVNSLKPPQPELLDKSILFSLVKLFFSSASIRLVIKPMVIIEPAVP